MPVSESIIVLVVRRAGGSEQASKREFRCRNMNVTRYKPVWDIEDG